MDDTDRALKFGLFLDSLCAGGSAMPQDAARSAAPSGLSRDASQAKPAAAIARGAK